MECSGSIIYEFIKTIHNFFLIGFLPLQEFGLIGSILSIIYLSVKFSDIGTTHALQPFFYLLQKSKVFFIKIFLQYFVLPQLPAIAVTAIIASMVCYTKFPLNIAFFLFVILPVLIFLETLRSFFRYFLHFSFNSSRVVIYEISSYIVYVSFIWIGLLWFSTYITALQIILLAHLIDSLCVVMVFVVLIVNHYKKLSDAVGIQVPRTILARINKMRIFNYLLRISRELFTNSFLTPLFAFKFGLPKIGLFFFAGSIATSIQSIIKAVIGFSGTALLANLKEESLERKKRAFELLVRKLLLILLPGIIIMLSNIHLILSLSIRYSSASLILISLVLFCCLLAIEFFFMLYEQFYIMEESAQHLFIVKLFEFLLLYLVIGVGTFDLLKTFGLIVLVRWLSFIIVVINAYYRWQLKPHLFPLSPPRYVKVMTILLVLVSLVINYFSF